MALPNHDHSGSKNDHGGVFPLTNLSSGEATAGQALVADGSGGAEWGDPGEGFEGVLLASTDEAAGSIPVADGSDGVAWDTLTASLVDAEDSTDGQVLTSNGAGGAAWESIPVQVGIPVAVTADWATPANAWADIKTATGMVGRVGADAAVATIYFNIWEGLTDADDYGELMVADDVASWPATSIMASYPAAGTVRIVGVRFVWTP